MTSIDIVTSFTVGLLSKSGYIARPNLEPLYCLKRIYMWKFWRQSIWFYFGFTPSVLFFFQCFPCKRNPNFFGNQNFFFKFLCPHIFFNPIFLEPKYLCGLKIYIRHKISLNPKFVLVPTFFLYQKFIFVPKIVWVQTFSNPNNFCPIFSQTPFFSILSFLDPNVLFDWDLFFKA